MTVKPGDSLSEAIELMAKNGFRRVPVVDYFELVGIITSTDILKALEQGKVDLLNKPIHKFMTPNPFVAYRDDDLSEAIQLMFKKNLGSLLIISKKDNTLAGIVTERDLVKAFADSISDADLEEFITKEAATLPMSTATIKQVIKKMLESHSKSVLLVKGKKVEGIITTTDLIGYLSEQIIKFGKASEDLFNLRANEIAIKDVITANINQSVKDVANLLVKLRAGGVPVIDDNNDLVGSFTEKDLLTLVGTYNLI